MVATEATEEATPASVLTKPAAARATGKQLPRPKPAKRKATIVAGAVSKARASARAVPVIVAPTESRATAPKRERRWSPLRRERAMPVPKVARAGPATAGRPSAE